MERTEALAFPATRHELMFYLYGQGITHANVFKEGPQYIIIHGGMVSATGITRINQLTFQQWVEEVRKVLLLE